jgi:hypothetical protein
MPREVVGRFDPVVWLRMERAVLLGGNTTGTMRVHNEFYYLDRFRVLLERRTQCSTQVRRT